MSIDKFFLTLQSQLKLGLVPSPYIFPFYIQFHYHMKEFSVSVRKLTDEDLMREACESTFLGKSHQSLLSIYKSEHSPARTQMFWVTLKNIPLYVSTHLLRHHVGSQPFQLSCRADRQGGNPGLPERIDDAISRLTALISDWYKGGAITSPHIREFEQVVGGLAWLKDNSDRHTPVNLSLCLNAQSLIDMAKLRLCGQASSETRIIFQAIKDKIVEIDPSLAKVMVPKCVYRNGLCGEPRCCGYNSTEKFQDELHAYLENFTEKQRGRLHEKRSEA